MGTTIIAYFISILLYFPTYPSVPQTGWVQWIYPFQNQMTCDVFLERERPKLIEQTLRNFEGVPVEIKGMECLTYKQAYKKNQELGHTSPFNKIDPDNNTVPSIVGPLEGIPTA